MNPMGSQYLIYCRVVRHSDSPVLYHKLSLTVWDTSAWSLSRARCRRPSPAIQIGSGEIGERAGNSKIPPANKYATESKQHRHYNKDQYRPGTEAREYTEKNKE
jgi:hypothetical protein